MHNQLKILNEIPDKQYLFKDTTSRLWKKELYEFFKEISGLNCLEIGTNNGWTSLWCSYFFDHVYTIENSREKHDTAKQLAKYYNRYNITFILGDAYNDYSYIEVTRPINVIIIDCIHEYDYVLRDINRALQYYIDEKIYLVFDDYGHPESVGVHNAVQYAVQSGLKIETYIGQEAGYVVHRTNGTSFQLIHHEGIILSYG